ncbi:hypothetical protein HPB47_023399 [Ixodes persulcatus]|uniref:Uncharacterized protein n=1 Tax=Ixodes persulcatus TaxID=34615 RepID=A0AC60Q902_IXOPE|nr:hypothetical protein HPB47_023399 [Ixodes persulcatus]
MSSTNPNFDDLSIFPTRDPRTLGWPLVGSKSFLVTLLVSYVYLVTVGGPRFMKKRKPYENLKPLILLYNLSMVFFNVHFFKGFLTATYLGGGYSIVCQGIDFEARNEVTMELLELGWWYNWVRIADFLDTIFFVLRKKDSHVSFLHVTHHVIVVFNGWFGLAYGSDGQIALGVLINTFVHIVMYSYYFLSLLGPRVRPYLWWKRYLTQLQLVQFVVTLVHMSIPFFMDCGYPRPHMVIIMCEEIFFFVTFMRFYTKAYTSKAVFSYASDSKNKMQ